MAPFDVTPEGEVVPSGPTILVASAHVGERAAELGAHAVGPGQPERSVEPHARGAVRLARLIDGTPAADLAGWEPAYGRLAEAQVRWEAEHGRPLAAG